MSHFSLSTIFPFLERSALFFALYALFGSALYYTNLAQPLFLLLICIPVIWLTLAVKLPESSDSNESFRAGKPRPYFLFPISYFLVLFSLLIASWWMIISQISITESVRSLWLVLPASSLAVLGLASSVFALITQRTANQLVYFAFFSVLLSSSLLLAAMLFPLGFGFDPFIHRATVSHIAEFGTISPKPLYYAGQYAIELFASEVLAIPLKTFDRFFLPVFASIFIPLFAIRFTTTHHLSPFSLFTLFLLPLSSFIITTPQSLGFIFSAAAIFFLVDYFKQPSRQTFLAPLIFTLASLCIHPISGIPSAVLLAIAVVMRSDIAQLKKRLLIFVFVLFGSISIPLLFFVNGIVSGLPLAISFANFDWQDFSVFLPYAKNNYNLFYDALYLIGNNLWVIFGVFAAIGLRTQNQELTSFKQALVLSAVISFCNYAILAFGMEFSFLPQNERQNYADRLLVMMAFFLLPLALMGASRIAKTVAQSTTAHQLASAIVLAGVVISSVYFTYPRHDAYARSGGFNVSLTDREIVQEIEKRAGGKEYAALANQAVSASALEQFGFKTYFHGTIFFYPIPTGGELYTHFLTMNEKPNMETIHAVQKLTGAETVYYVVNDYWWNAPQLIEQTKSLTNEWFTSGDGTIHVFIFSPLP